MTTSRFSRHRRPIPPSHQPKVPPYPRKEQMLELLKRYEAHWRLAMNNELSDSERERVDIEIELLGDLKDAVRRLMDEPEFWPLTHD